MDTNSKRRAAWRRDEMERRRTERGRQRSEMMSQRRQAAQTQYMDRMSQRALAGGATGNAAGAIAYGESRGEYADRRQGYMNAQSQRDLAASQGYAARTGADAQARSAEANYMGVQQRPELQKAANEARQRAVETQGQNAVNIANTEGSWGLRQEQLKVAAARENADAIRQSEAYKVNKLTGAQRDIAAMQANVNEPFMPHGAGGLRFDHTQNNLAYYPFPRDVYNSAGQQYIGDNRELTQLEASNRPWWMGKQGGL